MLLALLFVAGAVLHAGAATPADLKPKFGPDATPILQSHAYLRAHRAPDYWALNPYYVPQVSPSSCSLATVATVLNALRPLPAYSGSPLVTQATLLDPAAAKTPADPEWTDITRKWSEQVDFTPSRSEKVKNTGSGLTFSELHRYVVASLNAYGLDANVEVLKPADRSAATLNRLRRLLVLNERSAKDIALIYYNQGVVTGDWDGPHISPIGAYDPEHRRVLIMDVDRQWYVPYWTSDERLLEAMLRPAPADQGTLVGQTGGVVWVKLRH
jgi:hypothetical protein